MSISVPITVRVGSAIASSATTFTVEEISDLTVRVEQDYIDQEIQLPGLEHPKFIAIALDSVTTSGHISVKVGSNTGTAHAVNPILLITAYDTDGMTELTSPSLFFTNDTGAAVTVHIYAGE